MIAAIKRYLSLGLAVMPIVPGTKKPAVDWDEYQTSCPGIEEWRVWWKDCGGQCGVGIILGSCETPFGTQLVCVDTDDQDEEAWVLAQPDFPETVTAETAKGFHRYYLAPAGLQHFGGAPGLPEVRAGDHYNVLPPSVHPSGKQYRWLDGLAFGEHDLAELPEWGCELMRGGKRQEPRRAEAAKPTTQEDRDRKYGKSALGREVAELSATPEGGRNDALNAAAFCLGQLVGGGILDEQEVRQGLLGACHANGLVKQDGQRTVERTLNGGLEAGKANPRTAPERAPQRSVVRPATDTAPPPEPDPPTEEELASLEQHVAANVNGLVERDDPAPGKPALLSDIAGEIIDSLDEYRSRDRVVRGLRSGFPSLDRHYLGFSEQQLIVIQGPSGYGKTTFARHSIFATALASMEAGSKEYVLAFLLEDTKRGLLASYQGYRGVPRYLCEPGASRYMTPDWEKAFAAVCAEFAQLPIALQTGGRDMGGIEKQVRETMQDRKVVGVVIDHAQEIEVPGVTNLHERANQVAARCERLSKRIEIPVMILSQTTFKDGNYKPEYSDKLRQKSSLCEVITRGTPGCTREAAVQSNIMRVICDKSRWVSAHPMLTLQGDATTGRLTEVDEHAPPEPPREEFEWPGND